MVQEISSACPHRGVLFSYELTLDRRMLEFRVAPVARLGPEQSAAAYDRLLTDAAVAYAAELSAIVDAREPAAWFPDPYGACQRWGVLYARSPPFARTLIAGLQERGHDVLDPEQYIGFATGAGTDGVSRS